MNLKWYYDVFLNGYSIRRKDNEFYWFKDGTYRSSLLLTIDVYEFVRNYLNEEAIK